MRYAVLGHVEWVDFVRVERLPEAGQIVHASEFWAEPAGGGAVAAAQLARMAGEATFYTVLGSDELGRRALDDLGALGLRVAAAPLDGPQRRALTHVDSSGERTITVLGARAGPRRSDPLPWDELDGAHGVYFVSGDADALRAARSARLLVATSRGLETLAEAGVKLDVLLGSSKDAGERYDPGDLDPVPHLVVRTAGEDGGTWEREDGSSGSWAGSLPPGPVLDAYGAGDSFAAGLTYALGEGHDIDTALGFAAQRGAEALARKGAHGEGSAGAAAQK